MNQLAFYMCSFIHHPQGISPLHLSIESGNMAIVKLLLQGSGGGADGKAASDVNLSDHAGCACLHRAALTGNLDLILMLLGAGAAVDAMDNCSSTAFILANHAGDSDIASALIAAGANPQRKLLWAACNGHQLVVKEILAAGAPVDLLDDIGHTPLHKASR